MGKEPICSDGRTACLWGEIEGSWQGQNPAKNQNLQQNLNLRQNHLRNYRQRRRAARKHAGCIPRLNVNRENASHNKGE